MRDDVADVDNVVGVVVAVVVIEDVADVESVVGVVVPEEVAVVVAVVRSHRNPPSSCAEIASLMASISSLHSSLEFQYKYGSSLSQRILDSVISARSFQPPFVHSATAMLSKELAEHWLEVVKNNPSTRSASQLIVFAAPPHVLMRDCSLSRSAHDCAMSHDSS